MEKVAPSEHTYEAFAQDGERIGEYLTTALGEIAAEHAGQEFADELLEDAKKPDTSWLNVDSIIRLQEACPGAISELFDRTCLIQKQAHEQEIAELDRRAVEQKHSAFWRGFTAGLNPFAAKRSKR